MKTVGLSNIKVVIRIFEEINTEGHIFLIFPSTPFSRSGPSSYWLALPEDFRTADWTEIIKYPELVYQKSEEYMKNAFA